MHAMIKTKITMIIMIMIMITIITIILIVIIMIIQPRLAMSGCGVRQQVGVASDAWTFLRG